MADSSQPHKRREICANRPMYRDGRRDTAVKVFTINQESLYLLVQGVPDIKITDELLKLFSLYGTIVEYRILHDHPAEEFTKPYWIKYADIQAARVAKRKMDDHSFYGGFLHVCYAPEYESIQDTREKLQQRRMAIARRLRKLAQERSTQTAEDEGFSVPSETTAPTRAFQSHAPPTARGNGPNSTAASVPSEMRQLGRDAEQNVEDATTSQEQDPAQLYPALPNPPRHLPPWQWDIPSRPEFPRLCTAHDTLPAGFNPFPERGDQASAALRTLNEGPFIGPQMPARAEPGPSADSNGQLHIHAASSRDQRTNFNQIGARPKFRPNSTSQDTSMYSGLQTTSLTLSLESKVRHNFYHYGDGPTNHDDTVRQSPVAARPKLVARRRLGPDSPACQLQQFHLDPGKTPVTTDEEASTRAEDNGSYRFLPRLVNTSSKRSASSLGIEDSYDVQMDSILHDKPATGSSSFDHTVANVRQRLSQATQVHQTGSEPISALQTAINQARQRERMGLLPGRPPVKRQRI